MAPRPGSLAAALPTSSPAGDVALDELTLLEIADRLLHRGVVLVGEATISVAGVDLIYLGLNVVLAAVETLEQRAAPDRADPAE